MGEGEANVGGLMEVGMRSEVAPLVVDELVGGLFDTVVVGLPFAD